MRSLFLLLLQLVSLVISNKICDPSYFDVTSDEGRVEYVAFTGEEPPDLWRGIPRHDHSACRSRWRVLLFSCSFSNACHPRDAGGDTPATLGTPPFEERIIKPL
jgi:hypothetical protein